MKLTVTCYDGEAPCVNLELEFGGDAEQMQQALAAVVDRLPTMYLGATMGVTVVHNNVFLWSTRHQFQIRDIHMGDLARMADTFELLGRNS